MRFNLLAFATILLSHTNLVQGFDYDATVCFENATTIFGSKTGTYNVSDYTLLYPFDSGSYKFRLANILYCYYTVGGAIAGL